jgi:hypothetical protein
MLGTWLAAWAVMKGLFGATPIQSLAPAESGYSNWGMNLHNTIFDYFVPQLFTGTLIVSAGTFALAPLITRRRYRAKDLGLLTTGSMLAPLGGFVLLPILFSISGTQVTYYSQIFGFIGDFYSMFGTDLFTRSFALMYWFILPLLLAAVAVPCIIESGHWMWAKVLPPRWKEKGQKVRDYIVRRGYMTRAADQFDDAPDTAAPEEVSPT